ncbi:hypothetical protein O9992_00055 [Vibrio lentus]|nr:hypothetical protein [Vibrio lentus]
MTGSNDAPVAKTRLKRPKKTRYRNGNVPAATDVDGTVANSWLMMGPEGSLTFNDDGQLHVHPGD